MLFVYFAALWRRDAIYYARSRESLSHAAELHAFDAAADVTRIFAHEEAERRLLRAAFFCLDIYYFLLFMLVC